VPQTSLMGSAWQGSLSDLAHVVNQIKYARAFGRLSLRNPERLSIAHLYFRAGKLVHVVGNRGDCRAILSEMQAWTRGVIRFDRGVTTVEVTLNEEHEQLLTDTLLYLQSRGVVMVPTTPQIVESHVIVSPEVKQLVTPGEWRVLVEATRRVSLAVAHLVGPREALKVLQDILDDCSSAFPAFTCLKIAPSGYLQVTDRSQLDHMSREEVFEGFTALIATCQYFCSPIIGEREAHKLIIQALQDICPALVNMGVFHVDMQLLSSGSSRL
jgi:hypothetical protein